MKIALAVILLVLVGCEETTSVMRRQQEAWIGRSVQTFAETYSLVPTTISNDQSGRVYVFQKPAGLASCGVTLRSTKAQEGPDYLITGVISTCPPGAL